MLKMKTESFIDVWFVSWKLKFYVTYIRTTIRVSFRFDVDSCESLLWRVCKRIYILVFL